MRGNGVDFNPLVPLADLRARAETTGVVHSQANLILSERLPPSQIDDFRRDALIALEALSGRDITTDYGFNGSPFYSLVRQVDPTLHQPFGRGTALLNLIWQIAAALLVVWITGAALGVALEGRLAMAALLFASWDFVGWALPGLIFAGLWLPVSFALLAFRRHAAAPAGIAIAWAGLVKIFPFILLLPVGLRLIRTAFLRRRERRENELTGWLLVVAAACLTATVVLGFAALLSGRSWFEFVQKVVVQFQSKAFLLNSVSLSQWLFTFGIHGSSLPGGLSLVALAALAAMFLHGRDESYVQSLPRRSLVLLAATGWLAHTWFNYYTIAPLLLLPLVAQRHRVGAAVAAVSLAVAIILPEFDDPLLLEHRALFALKVLPYVIIPAWLVALEYQKLEFSRTAKQVAITVAALCCVAVAAEAVRMRAIDRLDRAGAAYLDRAEARDALQQYRRLVTLAPRNAMAHMNLGISLAMLERNEDAGEAFARAVELDPSSTPARQNYGRWLLKEKRYEEAAAQLEAGRQLSPYDGTVLFDLARARLELGRTGEATALLDRALELQPENRAVKRLLGDVERR
jgi:Tfp pilus assembly protein PilF